MKRSVAGLVLLLAFVAFSSYRNAAESQVHISKPNPKALYLEQIGSGKNKLQVYLTPHAIRVDNPERHFGIVCKAPDWNVIVWNDSSRTMSTVSHHDWCYKYAFHSFSWTCDLKAPAGKSKKSILGLDLTVYDFGSTPRVSLGLFRGNYGREDNVDDINTAEIATMPFTNSDKTGPIIGRLQMLPLLPGYPLIARRHHANGTEESALGTQKITDFDVPESKFKTPQYKQVPFNIKIMAPEDEAKRTEDFFGGFSK